MRKLVLTGLGVYVASWAITLILATTIPYYLSVLFKGGMAVALIAWGFLSAVVNARWGKAAPRCRKTLLCGLGGVAAAAIFCRVFCITDNSLYQGLERGLNQLVPLFIRGSTSRFVRLTMSDGFLQFCALLGSLAYHFSLYLIKPGGKLAVLPQARDDI